MDVRVNLGPRSYDIAVRTGACDKFGPFVCQRTQTRRAFVITDENARPHADQVSAALVAEGFHVELAPLLPGETMKSLEALSRLYDLLAHGRADRKSLVVAVGG